MVYGDAEVQNIQEFGPSEPFGQNPKAVVEPTSFRSFTQLLPTVLGGLETPS